MKVTSFDERVPSESDADRTHRIAGWLFCDCRGFEARGYCKHLRAKVTELLAVKSKAAKR